jgi:Cdc6-like AAA superfamily ATPase
MNDLERYTRSWGATAVPFGPLSDTQWVEIPSQQRALMLLNQTAALRGVMLLSGGNGVGKSALAGRWVRQLESRLFTPVNLTQATLSSSGLLASLTRGLGKQSSLRRERNLDELSSYLSEHERQTLVIVMDDAQNATHGTLEEVRLLLGLKRLVSHCPLYRICKAALSVSPIVSRGRRVSGNRWRAIRHARHAIARWDAAWDSGLDVR